MIWPFDIGIDGVEQTLVEYLSELDYTESEILNSGLGEIKDGKLSDAFKERLIFPLYDYSDTISGICGRVFEKCGEPKYKNTHSTKKLIFRNRLRIMSSDKVIICEYPLPAIYTYKKTRANVICTAGLPIDEEFCEYVQSRFKDVEALFMDDEYGHRNAKTAKELFEKLGAKIEILFDQQI